MSERELGLSVFEGSVVIHDGKTEEDFEILAAIAPSDVDEWIEMLWAAKQEAEAQAGDSNE